MRNITGSEKLNLRASLADTMGDTVQIGVYSESTDTYGDLVKTWTYGSNLGCGVEVLNGYEKINGVVVFTGVLVRVRLPYGTVVSTQDRIKFSGYEFGIKAIRGRYSVVVECEGGVV